MTRLGENASFELQFSKGTGIGSAEAIAACMNESKAMGSEAHCLHADMDIFIGCEEWRFPTHN